MNHTAIRQHSGAGYPATSPFSPSEGFPEAPFTDLSAQPNHVYSLLRSIFIDAKLDEEHLGSSDWNPLGNWIIPGMTVLLKPNMVLHHHPRDNDLDCLITHGSVVRAVLDYVHIALQGQGRIIIGDSPLQTTRFTESAEKSGISDVVSWYQNQNTSIPIELIDFRQVHAERDHRNHIKSWKEVPGDPHGYVEYDLGQDSTLHELAEDSHLFRVSNYQSEDTLQYHNQQSHRYVVAGSVIKADVIINLPKMKTHCKAGVTLGLKNFVGTIGRKQCLAHHREGGAPHGGDEYPDGQPLKKLSVQLEERIDRTRAAAARTVLGLLYRINERILKIIGANPIRDGGWFGNDTVWRMVIDLNRIALYGQPDGTLADSPQRKILTLIDGIIGGENEGPLESTPVESGCLVFSDSVIHADECATAFMKLDPMKIPLMREAQALQKWKIPYPDLEQSISFNGTQRTLDAIRNDPDIPAYIPAEGWIGHIELSQQR